MTGNIAPTERGNGTDPCWCQTLDVAFGDHHRHRELIALAVIVDDFAPRTLARFAGVPVADAIAAVEWGAATDIIVDGVVAHDTAAVLVDELGTTWLADVHVRVARQLLMDGCEQAAQAVHHARAAGALRPIPDLVDLMDRAAQAALSISDYAAARTLLETADEFADADDVRRRAWRSCSLAAAFDGLGRVDQSRRLAARAFDLAEITGDADLGLEAALLSAFPADWQAGDLRTSAIIRRADQMALNDHGRVALLAARALTELRIPQRVDGHQQVAWVTRESVAQPLAVEALTRSADIGLRERLVALLAWRTCHRAPRHLEQRLQTSLEALDISQQLRLPARQVEAALMLGADAIESADRPLFDHALSVATWVAQRDGNPRLLAHTRAMQAGVAFANGDLHMAHRLHREAVELATSVDLPSGTSLDFVMLAQHYIVSGEHPPRDLIPQGDHPILCHPLAQAATAVAWARLGEMAEAEALVRRLLRRVDEESSMLLVLVLAAEAVTLLESSDLSWELMTLLTPWCEHVAVDSNTWWHGGPVAAALAELSATRGDGDAARYTDAATTIATAMGDTRTLRRMDSVRACRPVLCDTDIGAGSTLSTRQIQVLELMATGLTNRQIASQLSYSVSTVKAELTAIFRALGVNNRAQAIGYVAQHHRATAAEPPTRSGA